jgi:hypothetical protein
VQLAEKTFLLTIEKIMKLRKISYLIMLTNAFLFAIPCFCAAVDKPVETQLQAPLKQAIAVRSATQQQEEEWRAEREKKVALYQQLQQQYQELEEQQLLLTQANEVARQRIDEKAEQLERSELIAAQIGPLLPEVTEQLETFQHSDLPFLSAEREQRLSQLQALVASSEPAVSEKLRKLIEALQIEADYGRSVEISRETIELDGQETQVQLFRFGRLALYFQTLDQQQSGFYNIAEQRWQALPAAYRSDLQLAFEIAANQRSAQLVELAIGRLGVQ